MLDERSLKKIYKVVSEETFQTRHYPQFKEESRLHYGIPELKPVKDARFVYNAEELSYTWVITSYDEFMKAVQDGEIRAKDFSVRRSIFGKKYVYISDRYDTYAVRESWFEQYQLKKYVKEVHPNIEMLRRELSAEEYIEWCKDHGIDLVDRALLNL